MIGVRDSPAAKPPQIEAPERAPRAGWPRLNSAGIAQRIGVLLSFATFLFTAAFRSSYAEQDFARAIPIDGEPFQARLVSAADGQFRFATKDRERTLSAEDLVTWGRQQEWRRGSVLILADGSLLLADVLEIDGESLTADSLTWGQLKTPLKKLRGVVLRQPREKRALDRLLDKAADKEVPKDRVHLDGGRTVDGAILRLGPRELTLRVGGKQTGVDRDAVQALHFSPALIEKPPSPETRTLVGLSDGGLLSAAAISGDETTMQVELVCGVTLSTEFGGLPNRVVMLRPLTSAVVYLSDLEPRAFRHVPFLDFKRSYGRDRSVLGTRLRAGGHPHAKGLGVVSTSLLLYDLKREYRRFAASLAIDDLAKAGGSVTFRVVGYSSAGRKTLYQSPVIRSGDDPVPIDIELTGVKRIALIVDFAERGDTLDYADWLDARLIK